MPYKWNTRLSNLQHGMLAIVMSFLFHSFCYYNLLMRVATFNSISFFFATSITMRGNVQKFEFEFLMESEI